MYYYPRYWDITHKNFLKASESSTSENDSAKQKKVKDCKESKNRRRTYRPSQIPLKFIW